MSRQKKEMGSNMNCVESLKDFSCWPAPDETSLCTKCKKWRLFWELRHNLPQPNPARRSESCDHCVNTTQLFVPGDLCPRKQRLLAPEVSADQLTWDKGLFIWANSQLIRQQLTHQDPLPDPCCVYQPCTTICLPPWKTRGNHWIQSLQIQQPPNPPLRACCHRSALPPPWVTINLVLH